MVVRYRLRRAVHCPVFREMGSDGGLVSIKLLFRAMRAEARADSLHYALSQVALHVGGTADDPQTVVRAAESARDALCRAKGHSGIPRNTDGHPVAFSAVGR